MKKLLLMMSVFAGLSAAQTAPDVSMTRGFRNGHWWSMVTDWGRLAYVTGVTDGASRACSIGRDASSQGFRDCVGKFEPNNPLPYGDIVGEITKLYADDPANKVIPVIWVEEVAISVFEGRSHQDILADLEFRRKFFTMHK